MGRIVIRKRISGAPGNGGNLALDGGTTGQDSGVPTIIGQSITGEPDSDDIGATGDNHQPDSTGAGNNAGDTPHYVDPTTATGGTADGTPKRRGRPRGSRNGTPRRATASQATSDISSLLLTVHFGLSKILKDDVWKLTEDEAKEMSGAVTRVTELYDIQIIPEKQMAWLSLAMVGASVYGPRIVATGNKKKKGPHIVEGNFSHTAL
jgi:hypothetical protein